MGKDFLNRKRSATLPLTTAHLAAEATVLINPKELTQTAVILIPAVSRQAALLVIPDLPAPAFGWILKTGYCIYFYRIG